MLLLFGYALTLDVDHIPTYVYDQDHTPAEPRTDRSVPRLALFPDPRRRRTTTAPIERGIDRSKILMGIVFRATTRAICWRARKPTCRFCWTAAIRIRRPSRWAMRSAIVQSYAAQLRSDAQMRRGGQPLKVAGRAAHARLVQQRSEIEELHRARPDRRDADDHRRRC